MQNRFFLTQQMTLPSHNKTQSHLNKNLLFLYHSSSINRTIVITTYNLTIVLQYPILVHVENKLATSIAKTSHSLSPTGENSTVKLMCC